MGDADVPLKLIFGTVGDGVSGKTSLITRIVANKFSYEQPPYFTDLTKRQIKGRQCTIRFVDCQGAETYKFPRIYSLFHASLLVFDLTDRESFANLPRWLSDMQKQRDRASEVAMDPAPVLLVGNKLDLVSRGPDLVGYKAKQCSPQSAVAYRRRARPEVRCLPLPEVLVALVLGYLACEVGRENGKQDAAAAAAAAAGKQKDNGDSDHLPSVHPSDFTRLHIAGREAELAAFGESDLVGLVRGENPTTGSGALPRLTSQWVMNGPKPEFRVRRRWNKYWEQDPAVAAGRHCREVTAEEAEQFARDNGLVGYAEVSAESGEGVDEVFMRVATLAVDRLEGQRRKAGDAVASPIPSVAAAARPSCSLQ